MKTTKKNLARRIAASSLLPRLLREFEGDESAQAKIQAAYDDLYDRALAVYGTPEVNPEIKKLSSAMVNPMPGAAR